MTQTIVSTKGVGLVDTGREEVETTILTPTTLGIKMAGAHLFRYYLPARTSHGISSAVFPTAYFLGYSDGMLWILRTTVLTLTLR